MNRVSSQLAARSGIRQIELLHAANQASSAVDAAIVRAWNRLMRLLIRKPRPPLWQLQHETRQLLTQIYLAAHGGLRDNLGRMVRLGHDVTARDLTHTLPLAFLKAANGKVQVRLAHDVGANGRSSRRSGTIDSQLGEALSSNAHSLFNDAYSSGGGPSVPSVPLKEEDPRLSYRDKLGRLREPTRRFMTAAKQRKLLASILFPSPTAQMVADILRRPIFGSSWEQDLSTASRLAGFDPNLLAQRLISGFSQGKNPREVAKDILPAVDGVKSSARRIARTYGVQMGHAQQRAAHEGLGDLVIGYQIHALLDQHTRPWHAARSGTIYYRNPEPGQKGFAQLPHPPLEADDPGERPPGTPQMAWN